MTQPSFYITTPIYYVNDQPHIGHAYTTLAADMIARFKRLDGYKVRFLTGTDEHGQKVQKAAEKADQNPQAFVDQVSQNFRVLSDTLMFTPDDFIRTTEPRHKKAVQHLWSHLEAQGFIYKGTYQGWYAVRDEAFYQENELVQGKAPTGADVEWVEESSYFFKLSAFQELLLEWYHKNPQWVAPEGRMQELVSFVKGGLKDLSISRTSFHWGIPVPQDPQHVIYVWMDALTNYISALGYPDDTPHMQHFWPEALHLVGKDILRFHGVYWPAFLMAAGLPLPKRLFAHGWWTREGQKMSKSLGNVLDPIAQSQLYGVDALRYFLIREVPFGQDGDFSSEAFLHRYTYDLAHDWGNLVQRVLSFVQKQCEGVIPPPHDLNEADQSLLKRAQDMLPTLRTLIDTQALHKYPETVWAVISEANRYIDHQKPWSLKNTDGVRMKTILYVLCQVIQQVALVLQPLMPRTSATVLDSLGQAQGQRTFTDLKLTPGQALGAFYPLFPKYEEVQPHVG